MFIADETTYICVNGMSFTVIDARHFNAVGCVTKSLLRLNTNCWTQVAT